VVRKKKFTMVVTGSIVLVAKCPIAGAVKTRLANELGDTGAASFAHAMLCDVLEQVGLSVSYYYYFGETLDYYNYLLPYFSVTIPFFSCFITLLLLL
jgi:hypothetical protein